MKRFLKVLTLVAAVALSACATRPEPVKLAMSQIDRGVMIWLPDNVMFEFGKSDLSAGADPYLANVAWLFNEKTNKKMVLEGHTDNVGSEQINQTLSEKRAQTVLEALTKYKVEPTRLSAAGYGFNKPIAPNDTETGRKLNRRVELIVIDETVANLMRGEPENAFEDAFARLKAQVDAIEQAPASAVK
jgi:outer membrane protein OmpA-like peptidoglycan-associated protein